MTTNAGREKGMDSDNRISEFWYLMKAIAIFSVLSAHSDYILDSGDHWYYIARAVFDCFGRIGVPVFFIASGYYFKIAAGATGYITFWKNKTIKIIFPWLIWGTIVWLYIVLRKGDATLANWFYYVVNGGSYLWFMKTMIVIYFLASLLKETILKFIGLVVACVTVLSWIFSVIPTMELFDISLLWISYFTLGLFLKKHKDLFIRFLSVTWKYGWVASVGVFALFLFETNIGKTFAYFGILNSINIFLWFILSSFICGKIIGADKLRLLTIDIGKCSYYIYLIHMLLAGVCNSITNVDRFKFFIYLRPIVVLSGTYLFIKILQRFKLVRIK